MHTRWTTCSRK